MAYSRITVNWHGLECEVEYDELTDPVYGRELNVLHVRTPDGHDIADHLDQAAIDLIEEAADRRIIAQRCVGAR